MTHRELAESFANFIDNDPELKPIIEDILLTGSVAKKEAKPDSDIDIVIILKEEPTDSQWFQLRERIIYYDKTQKPFFDVNFIKKEDIEKFRSSAPRKEKEIYISLIKKA